MLAKTADDLYPSRVGTRPRMLPRQDPVVYGEWTPEAPLTKDQTQSYEDNGFLVLKDVFDEEEIEALRVEAVQLHSGGKALLDKEATITEPGSGAVRSVFKAHEQSRLFARLAADSRLAEVARFILGDEVYIHQSRLNYKPGFKGRQFYWHSDFETWHVEDGMPRMRAVSMSILLTENTLLNGPLMIIPGSHGQFIACVGETPEEHYKQSLKRQEFGVPDEDSLAELASTAGIAAPTGPAGSVLLFDCNAIHGSNSNITPFPRSNAFFVFNAISNALVAPFGPDQPRPDFLATRGAKTTIQPIHGRLRQAAN